MARFALYGLNSRDFLTFCGLVIVHTNKAEMEWLFPAAVVRELPASFPAEQTMPLELHPDMVSVSWPLTKEQFRDRS
jgi:hypothetical protein